MPSKSAKITFVSCIINFAALERYFTKNKETLNKSNFVYFEKYMKNNSIRKQKPDPFHSETLDCNIAITVHFRAIGSLIAM